MEILCFAKNGSKYYLKYTFLAFPVLGILGLGTPLPWRRSRPYSSEEYEVDDMEVFDHT